MRKSKILSICVLLVFSCKQVEPLVNSIELEKWNQSTIDFALRECNINKLEYGSMLTDEDGGIVDFEYDISHILEKRKQVMEILKSDEFFEDINTLKLVERYNYIKSNPSFSFKKEGKYYSCITKNGEYEIKEQEGYGEEIFSLVNDSICMIDLKVRIANINIASKLSIKNRKVSYETLSLYIDSDF